MEVEELFFLFQMGRRKNLSQYPLKGDGWVEAQRHWLIKSAEAKTVQEGYAAVNWKTDDWWLQVQNITCWSRRILN